jgi:F1F0 ATPase subunit 2
MTTSEVIGYGIAVICGGALGAFFFGGLWWTVRNVLRSKRPAALLAVSIALRVPLTLYGFYVVSGGQWQRLVFCLCGFSIARYLIQFSTRKAQDHVTRSVEGGSHAP